MILKNNIKYQTLGKLDRIVREHIITLYLGVGSLQERADLINTNTKRILNLAKRITHNLDVDIKDLNFVSELYTPPEFG